MSYQRGFKRRKRAKLPIVLLVIALILAGLLAFVIFDPFSLFKDKNLNSLASAEVSSAPTTFSSVVPTVVPEGNWQLTIENKFGKTELTDPELCSQLREWYDLKKRQFPGSSNPFDNKCVLYYNEELVLTFAISSDDSRVMRSDDGSCFMILSDTLYDMFQTDVIEKGASLLASDVPGSLTKPDPARSLQSFPPEKRWDIEGYGIVVKNELGETILLNEEGSGIASVSADLISYCEQKIKTQEDPGEFDNMIWVVKDGVELLRLYSAGGSVLLNESQDMQMTFPEEMAKLIEKALNKKQNSFYEGKRFELTNNGKTMKASSSPSASSTAAASSSAGASAETTPSGSAKASSTPEP